MAEREAAVGGTGCSSEEIRKGEGEEAEDETTWNLSLAPQLWFTYSRRIITREKKIVLVGSYNSILFSNLLLAVFFFFRCWHKQ